MEQDNFTAMEQDNLTILDSSAVGRNIMMYRKLREIKASDMAERLGLKEAAYTKRERGETSLTVDFIQKVSAVLKVDPLMLLTTSPGSYIDSGNNSPGAILGWVHGSYNFQNHDESQTKLVTKLIDKVLIMNDSMMTMQEKIMELLAKK